MEKLCECVYAYFYPHSAFPSLHLEGKLILGMLLVLPALLFLDLQVNRGITQLWVGSIELEHRAIEFPLNKRFLLWT